MIAKEELTYGCLVSYRGLICSVFVIGEKGIGIRDAFGNNTIVSENRLDPIPITPGILKRNGFSLDKGHYLIDIEIYVSDDRRMEIAHISNTIGKDWSINIDNERFETVGGADIEYVHELQSILRLCKINKEVQWTI